MRRALAAIDFVSEWSGRLISLLIYFLTFILLYDVMMRFVFNSPTIWAHELSLHLFGAYAVLAGPYVLLHDQHVKIDIIYNRFSKRGRAVLDSFTFLIFFLFIFVMLRYGFNWAWISVKIQETISPSPWRSPVWPTKLTIPLAAFLMLIQGLAQFIRNVKLAITGKELT